MSLLKTATEEKVFDVRVVEKNLGRGRVDNKQVEKKVADLPDDANHAQYIGVAELRGSADTSGVAH